MELDIIKIVVRSKIVLKDESVFPEAGTRERNLPGSGVCVGPLPSPAAVAFERGRRLFIGRNGFIQLPSGLGPSLAVGM